MPRDLPRSCESSMWRSPSSVFFFFNDTATTEIYTLSLHDALPIWGRGDVQHVYVLAGGGAGPGGPPRGGPPGPARSEEHTSELPSRSDLVCRLLLEKKKTAPSGGWRAAA